jgi:enamine deaminase RidA (YjgF/YER057c/UK114 family)
MPDVWYENPPGTAPAQGFYSHAGLSRGGTVAFISGQLSVGANGEVAGSGNFEAQLRQVFQNLADVLKGFGTDYKSVLKFTTYLTRSEDIDKFMVLRRELFPKLFGSENYPPNTLLIVSRLVKPEFMVEVEAVVAVQDDSPQPKRRC